MKLIKTLKKHGGWKLIIQYFNAGVLHTAIMQFLILGKSRTALEILRESVSLKIKERLEKKYKKILTNFDRYYSDRVYTHESSNIVWVCWLQGMDNAPEIVRICLEKMKKHLYKEKVIIITEKNFKNYIDFPDYILNKWKSGVISNTHFTDLMRLELLIKYGGMWLDSTVLCLANQDDIPAYYFDSELFFYQCLKPGRDAHATYMSSWLISAKTNNKILMATKELCYAYWKKNNKMIDYFLLHDFMSVVLDYYEDDWKKIIPCDNATPHILLLNIFEKFDLARWNAMTNNVPFHKLSYKFEACNTQIENTNYKFIIESKDKL